MLQSLLSTNAFPLTLIVTIYDFMIKCEHCDLDAHYRLSIEDFNSAEVYSADLCIKCIEIEESKTVGNFPVTKSFKIEPVLAH